MISLKLKNQRGATAVIVGIIIFMILCFVPLAIDLVNLYVAKNELQNAADAGALAGALELYIDDGTAVNTGANQIAYNTATANMSQKTIVDIKWSPGAPNSIEGEIQRGHWSFGLGTNPTLDGFSHSVNTSPTDLWNVSEEDLDQDPNFINAVWVKTRRGIEGAGTPVVSFFARIFGYESFDLEAEAVAYIGFAGTMYPDEVDQPIAFCRRSIVDATSGLYTCVTGRMSTSSTSNDEFNSTAWTNFTQDLDKCDSADADEIKDILGVCGGNNTTITLGDPIGTMGGVADVGLAYFDTCWRQAGLSNDIYGFPTEPWYMTLPVIDCEDLKNPNGCLKIVGVVEVALLWHSTDEIKADGPQKTYRFPTEMAYPGASKPAWSRIAAVAGTLPDGGGGFLPACPECEDVSSKENKIECWKNFAMYFNLIDQNDTVDGFADYKKKSLYFLPDCTAHEPTGLTGGENFGVLAKIPVLVD